jgi:GT2 family glycosyltransferase
MTSTSESRAPRCTVIVPVHNRSSLTRGCLTALLRESTHIEFETVVVDDGSTDDTSEILAEFSAFVRVVRHAESRGFAAAANSGVWASAGQYLVFLNNDTIPTRGWIDNLVAYADAHQHVAVVGSKLLYPDDTIQHAGVAITIERIPRHIYLGFPGDHPATNRSRPFQAVTAAATLIRREAFESAQGFDESFVNGYEDIDLCLRLGEQGAKVHYCHQSVLHHLEKATRGFETTGENHDLFVKRWPHLKPDDLEYYIADGLLQLTYRDHFPIEMHVSPLLAVVDLEAHDREADSLLAARAQQVFELLQENTRLRLEEPQATLPHTSNGNAHRPDHRAQKAVLFLSGSPGDAMRYRCDHQAEALGFLGVTADVARVSEVAFDDVLERYHLFVLHRVAYGPDLEWFIQEAHVRRKPVVFDTDDLVFEPSVTRHVPALDDMTVYERTLYHEGLTRYRDTLLRCDAVIVTTEALRAHAEELHPTVFVVPNAVSSEMVRLANGARQASAERDQVAIGYLSGTKTHNKDFVEAADAVLEVLEENEQAELHLVGLIDLDDRFTRFSDRIKKLPIQPWQRLPAILAEIDINLAPLERNNPFTESKSCIKYLEAGLVGVPTIASSRSDFVRAVVDGESGFLADSPDQWTDALRDLVGSADRRRRVGEAARADVEKSHTTLAQAPSVFETFRVLAETEIVQRPLIINWVLHAPIAQTSGGYRTIFKLARHLASKGHLVRTYIAPVAHLEQLSDPEIREFIARNFDVANIEILVNRSPEERPDFLAADVSIATFWPTATTVALDGRSLFKAYFIQDFEPEFYPHDPVMRERARASYDLPLKHICIGKGLSEFMRGITHRPVDHIDFALRPAFRLRRDPDDRGERVSILFFARPQMPRRGFSLGCEALARLKDRCPDTDIVFFGCEDDELGSIPFPYRNLGVIDAETLATAMNSAHILLTFSLSNISHVPYEGMACGCAVVEADSPMNTGMLNHGENCLLVEPDAGAVATALEQLVEDGDLRRRLGLRGAKEMEGRTWLRTGDQFESALRRLCFARVPRLVEAPTARDAHAAVGGAPAD